MYNNPYYVNNNSQINLERIDNQIKELESMRNQLQRTNQPAINQTFQLAPTSSGIKYVSGEEDVAKELVFQDSIFLNKDFTRLWLKGTNGKIKSYEMSEIVKKDEKDLRIEELEKELEELRGKKDEQSNGENVDAKTKSE